jgi:hypothetical protein
MKTDMQDRHEQSPYAEALAWIEQHSGTGSALGLAKLILSVWNDECGFSFRECVGSLDGKRTALALRVVAHFARVGEDAELVKIGHAVNDHYPRLWELSMAANEAKSALRATWAREDEKRRKAEYDDH